MFRPHEEVHADGYLRFGCDNLTADNKCGIYATRPDTCRTYPDPRIIQLGGGLLPGCGYRIVPEKGFDEVLAEKLSMAKEVLGTQDSRRR